MSEATSSTCTVDLIADEGGLTVRWAARKQS
jgi:hypothetical protein